MVLRNTNTHILATSFNDAVSRNTMVKIERHTMVKTKRHTRVKMERHTMVNAERHTACASQLFSIQLTPAWTRGRRKLMSRTSFMVQRRKGT